MRIVTSHAAGFLQQWGRTRLGGHVNKPSTAAIPGFPAIKDHRTIVMTKITFGQRQRPFTEDRELFLWVSLEILYFQNSSANVIVPPIAFHRRKDRPTRLVPLPGPASPLPCPANQRPSRLANSRVNNRAPRAFFRLQQNTHPRNTCQRRPQPIDIYVALHSPRPNTRKTSVGDITRRFLNFAGRTSAPLFSTD